MNRLDLLLIKIKISIGAALRTFRSYRYVLLAAFVAIVFFEFLYWFLNLQFLWFILTASSLDMFEKVKLIFGSSLNYFVGISIYQAVAVVLLSTLQGIVVALLVFVLKSQQRLDVKAFGGSAIASVIALFSVGCVSCGTSVVTPILSIFVSGVSASLSDSIHQMSVYVGLVFAVYALYATGQSVANIQARVENRKI